MDKLFGVYLIGVGGILAYGAIFIDVTPLWFGLTAGFASGVLIAVGVLELMCRR